jgi:hypothetical protein
MRRAGVRGVTSANSTASRCAVLIAIPATREEFDAAMCRTPLPDFLESSFLGVDPAEKWKKYHATANGVQALVATARKLNAGVYAQATLESVSDATARYQYIVICAHWRGPFLMERDLMSDPDAIVQRIRRHPAFISVQPQACGKKDVVKALNSAIEDSRLLNSLRQSLQEAAKLTPAIGHVLSRDIIDRELNGDIAPGNCIELFDGSHPLSNFEMKIARNFAGELDLALCNSVALAIFLDLRRDNRIPNLYWPCAVHPVPQLLKIATTLEIMGSNGGGYIDTRLSVEEAELRDGP